jgi:hypothetical protein
LRCARCGNPSIWGDAAAVNNGFRQILNAGNPELRRGNLSSFLRKFSGKKAIDLTDINKWPLDQSLPLPMEVRDALLMMVAEHVISPANSINFMWEPLAAQLRLPIDSDVRGRTLNWYINQNLFKDLMHFSSANELLSIRLTVDGWERYDSIRRETPSFRTIFMAMQYGDAELTNVVEAYFRPAVDRAGFNLRVLTDQQPAGSIDDLLRVAMRTSRAVIADLTHGNKGAYWEAGFAEGLGRPVIYSCKHSVWESKDKPHFDTNHLATIIWDPAKLETAAGDLTNMIRATLPGEAKMDD